MSAERIPEYQPEAEIIYLDFRKNRTGKPAQLVIRPYHFPEASPANETLAYKLYELCYNQIWALKRTKAWSSVTETSHCLVGSVIFTVNSLIVLYALYYLKSMMGIDIFPHQHLEDFFPIPGYQRW